MKKTVLEINIEILGVTEVQGGAGEVRMIEFGGSASGGLFTGTVLSGAVDTQKSRGGTTALSARYILSGTDSEGNECKIFIENNGFDCGGNIITSPSLLTDSPVLRRLETAPLSGGVIPENGGLTVKIYEEI